MVCGLARVSFRLARAAQIRPVYLLVSDISAILLFSMQDRMLASKGQRA